MTKPQQRTSIPAFVNRQEEAEFWDTHDVTDYLDELKPVEVAFARHLSEGLTVRLDPGTVDELRALAKDLGIGPTTLMRMWILERLHAVRKERAAQ
ncbi:MAG: hypothetical protein NVS2B7_19580 [Herpetosiphon sp.]